MQLVENSNNNRPMPNIYIKTNTTNRTNDTSKIIK